MIARIGPLTRRCWIGFGRFFSARAGRCEDEDASFGCYGVILPEEPFVWGVSHIRPRTVPPHIRRPSYAHLSDSPSSSLESLIEPGSADETKLRASCKLAGQVRAYARTLVRPGVTTNAIDAAIHAFIIGRGAYPSPLLYKGFPRSCCTSVNNVAAHGIPDDRPLEDGDVVNVDVTVYLDGFHGDTSQTFLVGDVDAPGRDLVATSDAALQAGIAACIPGRPFRAIGEAIHDLVRARGPYSICEMLSGHGIGRAFHQAPHIFHTRNDEPGVMRPGHCFTIEPCIVQGSDSRVWIFPDGWTVSTENCARSAQAEHTVLITESGVDVLTL